MADTNKTILKTLLQFRRDSVFTESFVLEAGEPGFEISTGTLKIGDGTSTWGALKIANNEEIGALISAAIASNNENYYTQAEINKLVEDLKTELGGDLEEAVDGLNGAIEGINGTIATLATKAELEGTVASLEDKITEAANGAAGALATHIEACEAEDERIVGLVETEAGTRATEISRVEGLISAEAKNRQDANDDLKDYVDGLIAAEEKERTDADTALDNKITDLETRIGNVTNVMNFRGAVNNFTEVTTPVEGDVVTFKAELKDGDTVVAKAGSEWVYSAGEWVEIGTASATDAAVADLQRRADAVEGEVDVLQADINTASTGLKARMTKAEDDIGTAAGRLDDHDEAIDDLVDRADAAETAIEALQGKEGDTKDSVSIKGAKLYTDAAKAEVIGTANDAKTVDTIKGAKAFASDAAATAEQNAKGYADDKKAEVIGTDADTKTADTIKGAKVFATDAAGTAKSEAIGAVVGSTADDADQNTVYGAKAFATAQAAAAKAEAESYADGILEDAQDYTDNALKAAAASVKAGTANDDIIVTPDTTTGETTVAHKTYATGTYTKAPESSTKTGDIYFFDSIATSNGHVTGGTMKSLASILEGMTFIFDGGTSTN